MVPIPAASGCRGEFTQPGLSLGLSHVRTHISDRGGGGGVLGSDAENDDEMSDHEGEASRTPNAPVDGDPAPAAPAPAAPPAEAAVAN